MQCKKKELGGFEKVRKEKGGERRGREKKASLIGEVKKGQVMISSF